MAQMSQRSSYRPYGQASTFVYIFHLISIDLQLSRSLNSPTLQRLYYSSLRAIPILKGESNYKEWYRQIVQRLKL